MQRKLRIAFDLDETLGVPIIDGSEMTGFLLRKGCIPLLEKLKLNYELVIWTVSNRSYLNKILSYRLKDFFSETYSWDELQISWKDIRKIQADYLIDDSETYKEEAFKHGIAEKYLVITAYGSKKDFEDALFWVKEIEDFLAISNTVN